VNTLDYNCVIAIYKYYFKRYIFERYMSDALDYIVSDFSRFYILTILYEGPNHGYGIMSRFRKRLGKDITPSLVYPFLQLLEQKGVISHTMEPVGKKQRKIYNLTPEGKKLTTRLFKRFADLVSVALEPNLSTCAHCGCKVYEGGHAETINGEATTFCCKHCASSYILEH
jgi:DNA-binding PadR family transcriptional regulator